MTPKKNRVRFVFFLFCLAWALVCLFPRSGRADRNYLRVHFFSVGFGNAALFEFPDSSTLMIDAGPHDEASKLLKYLSRNKIQKIDTAIITHPHSNHFGGFLTITRKIPLARVFINGDDRTEEGYSDLLKLFHKKKIPVQTLRMGSSVDHLPAQTTISILNPSDFSTSPNDSSFVIWLRYGQTSFLLTTDIGDQAQRNLIRAHPEIQSADCIEIPHHGGPIDADFARFFRGKIFVISTGKNTAGIPTTEDLKKIEGTLLRTDLDGDITIESDGRLLKIVQS